MIVYLLAPIVMLSCMVMFLMVPPISTLHPIYTYSILYILQNVAFSIGMIILYYTTKNTFHIFYIRLIVAWIFIQYISLGVVATFSIIRKFNENPVRYTYSKGRYKPKTEKNKILISWVCVSQIATLLLFIICFP